MLAKRVAVGSAEAQIAAIPSLSPGQRAEAASRNPIANTLTSPAGPLLQTIFFNRTAVGLTRQSRGARSVVCPGHSGQARGLLTGPVAAGVGLPRTEGSRVGKAWFRKCTSRWTSEQSKKQQK